MPAAVVTAAKELPLSPFMGGRRPYVKWVWNGIGTVYGQKVSYACKISSVWSGCESDTDVGLGKTRS